MSEPALLVVDPDLVWQTDLVALFQPHEADSFPAVEGALAVLEPGRPTGLVIGPGLAADALAEVPRLRAQHPELLVVLVVEAVSAAMLQEAMRAGVFDVLDGNADRDLLRMSFAEVVSRLAGGADAIRAAVEGVAPGELVVVTGAKAGEGATAVAIGLAAALADGGGRSVALIDADPRFGDVALGLRLPPPELGDGFDGLDSGRQAVLDAIQQHPGTGLMVLSPPRSMAAAESTSEQRVVEVISAVQAVADAVVVDAPFRLVEQAELLGYADRVYLVSDPDQVSLKNAMIAVQVLGRAGAEIVVELVLNRCTGDGPDLDDVSGVVGVPVAAALPRVDSLEQGLGEGMGETLATIGNDFTRAVADLATRLTATPPA